MENHNSETHGLYRSKLEQRVVFFFVGVGVIALTYGFLFLVDFLPEKPGTNGANAEEKEHIIEEVKEVKKEAVTPEPKVVSVDPYPLSIIFDSLNREVKVLNPQSNDVATLDNALLSGVVRHPDSASFEQTGTIFLLGHSSYLPKVNNKNFQAFNGIQKLEWGDTIRLRSKDMEYVYSVDRVYETKAAGAEVALEWGTSKLILATCNSFGTKDDRYIVEATLVSTKSLAS